MFINCGAAMKCVQQDVQVVVTIIRQCVNVMIAKSIILVINVKDKYAISVIVVMNIGMVEVMELQHAVKIKFVCKY